MTPRLVIILAAAAAISTGVATAAWQSNHKTVRASGSGERLLPRIVERFNDIATVTIREGADTLELARGKDGWRIKQSGYPVSVKKLQNAVVGIVQFTKLEPKTASAAKYPVIEVEDPGKKGGKSREFTLKDDKGAELGRIIVGKDAFGRAGPGKDAQYVRVAGDKQSWLATGKVRAGVALKDWIDTEVVKLNINTIIVAKIKHADGEVLEVKRAGTTEQGAPKFEIVGMPEGKKAKTPLAVRYTATDLADISMENVRPLKARGTPVSEVELTTDKGLILGYRLVEEADKGWISVAVLDKGKDAANADKISRIAKGWEFGLPDYKIKQFKKRMSELLE